MNENAVLPEQREREVPLKNFVNRRTRKENPPLPLHACQSHRLFVKCAIHSPPFFSSFSL